MPDELYRNAYGYFRGADAAFVIENVRTPRPWANVMSNDRYGLVLSQNGGGFSWLGNCQLFRLSRWEQDLVRDGYGRYVYVIDRDTGVLLGTTTPRPAGEPERPDRVTHGLGWTTFERLLDGVEVTQTVFVPPDLDAEIWLIRLTNQGKVPRRLKLASYVEWQLGGVGDLHREFHRLFMESRATGDTLVAWKHANLQEGDRGELEEPVRAVARWIGGGNPRWITDKSAFLGPEGDTASPSGVLREPAPSTTPRWDDPIAGGIIDMDLAPGEERELGFLLGAAVGEESARALTASVDIAAAKALLEETKTYWKLRCGAMQVNTGDPDVDFLANTWLPYQTIAGRMYARCAYYQQGGAYGYRDQLQDSLMLLQSEPAATLAQLARHAEAMYPDGSVKHWWHPGTTIGPDSHHSDTSCWLAYGLLAYFEATGDLAALDQIARYFPSHGEGTLREHMLRGLDRALERRSPRGLPLIGAGDWNDGLSHAGIDGKGESVWMAMFLYDILRRLPTGLAEKYAADAEALRVAVEAHAWDGDWYIAGTRDDGRPFGARENEEGQIFLNPQTWAVISGIGSPERTARAMQSAKERLVTDYGALLLQPAFSKVDPYIGYITRYAPGLRENGGVYSHASTWAVWAFAKAGDLETARRIYRGMLPHLRAVEDADHYAAEPYVMPGNADGPDSPYAGRAGWTWYTGSSAWMVRVARDWLSAVA